MRTDERGAPFPPGTAVVTGASAGIGEALARELASDGWSLVLTARREGRLRGLAADLRADGAGGPGREVRVLPADLSRREGRDGLHREVVEAGIEVDLLVNNAGFGTRGPFVETDLEDELDLLEVNVSAVTHLTKLFLGGMLERGRGRVLNVASTAAFQPGPRMAVYYASKAYVLSFSEALVEELRETPVTVTTLCPGPTRTEFQERAKMEDARLVQGPFVMEARAVARAGIRGMEGGKRVVIPGVANRIGALTARLSPRWLAARVAELLNADPPDR